MAKEYLDDFFRNQHEVEFNRREGHDALDSFLLGAVVLLGGIGWYYFNLVPRDSFDWWTIIFLGIGAAFAFCWVAALWCLIGSVWMRDIAYLPTPKDLNKYAEDLSGYHRNFHTVDEQIAEKSVCDFRNELRGKYIECAQVNRESNQQKRKWQSQTKRWLIRALVLAMFNLIPAWFVRWYHPVINKMQLIESPAEHRVRILNPSKEVTQ